MRNPLSLKFQRLCPDFKRFQIIRTSRFSVSVHSLAGPDPDYMAPHDHGCDFFSFIIRGGYTENVYRNPFKTLENPEPRPHRRFSCHILRNSSAHRIVECTPRTLTLFVTWNHQGRRAMAFTRLGHLSYADYYGKGLHVVEV